MNKKKVLSILSLCIISICSVSQAKNSIDNKMHNNIQHLDLYKEELREVNREHDMLVKERPFSIGEKRRKKEDLEILEKRKDELEANITKLKKKN